MFGFDFDGILLQVQLQVKLHLQMLNQLTLEVFLSHKTKARCVKEETTDTKTQLFKYMIHFCNVLPKVPLYVKILHKYSL